MNENCRVQLNSHHPGSRIGNFRGFSHTIMPFWSGCRHHDRTDEPSNARCSPRPGISYIANKKGPALQAEKYDWQMFANPCGIQGLFPEAQTALNHEASCQPLHDLIMDNGTKLFDFFIHPGRVYAVGQQYDDNFPVKVHPEGCPCKPQVPHGARFAEIPAAA